MAASGAGSCRHLAEPMQRPREAQAGNHRGRAHLATQGAQREGAEAWSLAALAPGCAPSLGYHWAEAHLAVDPGGAGQTSGGSEPRRTPFPLESEPASTSPEAPINLNTPVSIRIDL